MNVDERRQRWLDTAIENAQRGVLDAGEGGRNVALNAAAFSLARCAPLVTRDEAERLTVDEGLGRGIWTAHEEREARRTFKSGWEAGSREGSTVPAELLPCAGGWTAARRSPSPTPTVPRPAPEPPPRPPREEVAAVWQAARPILDDNEAAQWVAGRGLDSAKVEDLDAALVLPHGLELPGWARCRGVPWIAGGFRLVVQGWSAAGELESLHARSILADPPPAPDGSALPKGAWPSAGPGSAKGLVMADALALQLLKTGELPTWWPQGEPLVVVVAEGVPDFLVWASRFSDADETAPAVFGIASGSWTKEIAARVPRGCKVAVRTHHDGPGKTGDKYAWRTVWTSLVGNLGPSNVVRPKAPVGKDDNDLLLEGRLPFDPFEDVEDA